MEPVEQPPIASDNPQPQAPRPTAGKPAKADVLSHTMRMFLKMAPKANVSDLHLDVGRTLMWRIDGRLIEVERAPEVQEEDILSVLKLGGVEEPKLSGDLAIQYNGDIFRISYGRSQGKLFAVLRHIRSECPSLDQIGVPTRFRQLLDEKQGVVVISGRAGNGKSTTMNAAIDAINSNPTGGTVYIMGDPIEYYHKDRTCRIRHHEYGSDFTSWSDILGDTMRRDPNVICVSEMRDNPTLKLALNAGDTGHLVLATLHNATAKDGLTRLLEVQDRVVLMQSLKGILVQKLVPKIDGGRVAAFELMIVNPAIANVIREGRFQHVDDEIFRGKDDGMTSMEDSLYELHRNGFISRETAFEYANNPETLEKLFTSLSRKPISRK